MMRANVPATGGQILPDLTRAVCGYLFTCLTAGARPGSAGVFGGALSMRVLTHRGAYLLSPEPLDHRGQFLDPFPARKRSPAAASAAILRSPP